jgi:hypothetical protein
MMRRKELRRLAGTDTRQGCVLSPRPGGRHPTGHRTSRRFWPLLDQLNKADLFEQAENLLKSKRRDRHVVIRNLPKHLIFDLAQTLYVNGQCGSHPDRMQVVELWHLMCRESGVQIVRKLSDFTLHLEAREKRSAHSA